MQRGKNVVSIKNEFTWEEIPSTDLKRLAKNLQSRARADDELKLSLQKCLEYTERVLKDQKGTCLLAGGISKYCWNEPRVSKPHLMLQWSHKVPVAHTPKKTIENFILLCARCNNQLQSSRTLTQLKEELIHKLKFLNSLAEE